MSAEPRPPQWPLGPQAAEDRPTVPNPGPAERAREIPSPSAEPPSDAATPRRAFLSLLGELAETLLLAFLLFLLIRTALQTYRVDGSSMEPNFYDGQFLVVDKVTPRLVGFRRGDVVVFHYPQDPSRDYIKRIVALPGEEVEIRAGVVYVNGQPLEEPYGTYPAQYSWGPALVGEGQLFVLGDNRSHSSDSHTWGMLDQRQVVGRAWLRYWPPDQWGLIPRYTDARAHR
ncbi:MAG: signal peptidase I [Anaerolineae bacterium]